MDLPSGDTAGTLQIWEFSPDQPGPEATASNRCLHSHSSHCLLRSANNGLGLKLLTLSLVGNLGPWRNEWNVFMHQHYQVVRGDQVPQTVTRQTATAVALQRQGDVHLLPQGLGRG